MKTLVKDVADIFKLSRRVEKKNAYLFPQENVHLVQFPWNYNMYSRQHHSSDDRCPHPDREQCVDNMNEENGPPYSLRSTSGLHEKNTYHLYHQDDKDNNVTDDPHVVLVESIPITHDH